MAQKCFRVSGKEISTQSRRFTGKSVKKIEVEKREKKMSIKLLNVNIILLTISIAYKYVWPFSFQNKHPHIVYIHLQRDLTDSVAVFMAYVLGSVNEISKTYLTNERRFNYTTPKSYLELISLYSKLLTEKTDDHIERIQRLENGLIRLAQCGHQVDTLKV